MAKQINNNILTEGLSFKEFLTEFNGMTVRDYIRGLDTYQELVKNSQTKTAALQMARSFVQEFEGKQMNRDIASYIQDEFAGMSTDTYGGGVNVGDWAGEEEFKQRKRAEKDMEKAGNKWGKTTGMDPETGQPLPNHDKRGRVKHGARTGMSHLGSVKSKRAAQDFMDQGVDRPEYRQRVGSDAPGEHSYRYNDQGQPQGMDDPRNKKRRVESIAKSMMPENVDTTDWMAVEDWIKQSGKEIKRRMIDELDMSKAGANTYFYAMKKALLKEFGKP